jgi:hypothetical protein
MNERIQKIAEQAGLKVNADGEISPAFFGSVDQGYRKFAELIVRECIEVFSKDMPDPTSPDYKLGTLNEVVDRVCNVAEHFGVKE